jgi:hypothetical protein
MFVRITVALALREGQKSLAFVKIAVLQDKTLCTSMEGYGYFCL